uniref:Uncharacterized protein n=1 Tax=Arundo donax TaxID=35708 RepID=A0A0A9FR27_ARUDO
MSQTWTQFRGWGHRTPVVACKGKKKNSFLQRNSPCVGNLPPNPCSLVQRKSK